MSGLRIRQPGAWSPSQHSQAPAGAAKLGGERAPLLWEGAVLTSRSLIRKHLNYVHRVCVCVCVCVCVYDTHTQELNMFLFMYLYFSPLNFTYHLVGLL